MKFRSQIAKNLTLICYVLLLVLMIITSFPVFLPENSSVPVILSIKLIPLLILMPGLLLNSLRSYIWLCFIILFYFTQAVVESFLSLGASLDLLITFLTVVLFNSAMLHIKWERTLGRTL